MNNLAKAVLISMILFVVVVWVINAQETTDAQLLTELQGVWIDTPNVFGSSVSTTESIRIVLVNRKTELHYSRNILCLYKGYIASGIITAKSDYDGIVYDESMRKYSITYEMAAKEIYGTFTKYVDDLIVNEALPFRSQKNISKPGFINRQDKYDVIDGNFWIMPNSGLGKLTFKGDYIIFSDLFEARMGVIGKVWRKLNID